jgi:mannose-6-phosphate isomerase-like protein (cupin superfamily)
MRRLDMIKVIDLNAEFAKLTMLKERSPTTTQAEKNGAIARLAPYRDGAIFMSKFAGTSDWERHPQGDEIVQIVDGATTLNIMAEAGLQSLALHAGMVAIVPQGMWHRFQSVKGVSVLTATPQPTDHRTLDVNDARTLG